jgi:hypothetical protein
MNRNHLFGGTAPQLHFQQPTQEPLDLACQFLCAFAALVVSAQCHLKPGTRHPFLPVIRREVQPADP